MSRLWVFLIILAGASPMAPGLAVQSALRQAPRSVLQQSAEELRQGKVAEAKQTLQGALKLAPRDPVALGLLGIVLDAEKRFEEAEKAYQQALAITPNSPALLNNLGNHYLAAGKADEARAAFLRVTAAKPRHSNVNLQLAKLSVAAKQGGEALKFLDRLGSQDQSLPFVAILRARALDLSAQNEAAEEVLDRVEKQAGHDPAVSLSLGIAYVEGKHFEKAESAFTRALDADPTSFNLLYNLALAAQHAGHLDRATEVYGVALRQRPNDADCLFNLASIHFQTGHADEAIVPLIEAHKAAPQRPEILFALAQASQEIGFYGDAASALDEYLKLKPSDDIARRERGFCLSRSDTPDQGIEDLRWYAQKHPRDARGLYELALAETMREPDKALHHLNLALAVDPKFSAARIARGELYYQMGRTDESIADLKIVLSAEPDSVGSLDALGADYMRLERFPQAVEVLARAYQLAPKEPRVLTHYAHALARAGRKEEAERVLAEFRALSPQEGGQRPHGGLFSYLGLTPKQQLVRYMENLQRNIAARPDDAALRVQLGKALLRQNKPDEAIESFRAARRLVSNPDLLATCGNALFLAGQYVASREFLEPAVAAMPSAADLRLDLAIAVSHSAGPEDSEKILDQTPSGQRNGDYYLLRARLLDAMNKDRDATEALYRGFTASPKRPDLYFQGALILVKRQQYKEAIQILEYANQSLPDEPELQLLEAVTYVPVHEPDNTLRILTHIESRWPEWALPYMFHGITLEICRRSEEARPMLENAIALGADSGISNYYLALALADSTPPNVEEANRVIARALQLTPDDVYIQSLAGKIAFLRKDYPGAMNHLSTALRLSPEMTEAHKTLAQVYEAEDEEAKSAEELQNVRLLEQSPQSADQMPTSLFEKLLFSVPPPSPPPM